MHFGLHTLLPESAFWCLLSDLVSLGLPKFHLADLKRENVGDSQAAAFTFCACLTGTELRVAWGCQQWTVYRDIIDDQQLVISAGLVRLLWLPSMSA